MSRVTSKKSGLTSSGLALLAGVGAVAAAGEARAATGQILVKAEGDRVFVSQGAGFQELKLGQGPDAAHLRGLLRDAVRTGETLVVPVDPFIVANGGGGADGDKHKSSAASSSGEGSKGSDGEQKKDK
jgi:hypothetical protein